MADILLAVSGMLVVISAIQPLARRLRVSDAVLLAVVGALVGAGAIAVLRLPEHSLLAPAATALLHVPVGSDVFFDVFLPLLVFHGALSIDVRALSHDAVPVLVLAVVAVLVATAAIGYAVFPLAGLSLTACLMFGAIVATTDPSAVITIFRDIGAHERLSRLVEGESLLNDAAAITLFTILLGDLTLQGGVSVLGAARALAISLAGGCLVGVVLARAALLALRFLGGLRAAEVTLTLALAYLAYLVSDTMLGFSGVVAAAAAGLTFGAFGPTTLRPRSWSFLVDVWAQVSFVATSLVFVLASLLIPRLLLGIRWWDVLIVGVVVFASLLARAAVLFVVLPLLAATRLSQRVPARMKLVVLWGGLRGSITLAMAASVIENPAVPPAVQRFIAIVATGYVLFTLLVNGTTLRFLVSVLGLDRLSAVDEALRNQVVAIGLSEVRGRLAEVSREIGFSQDASSHVLARYAARAKAEAEASNFDAALTDRDRLRLGLLTCASQEKAVLLELFRDRGVSRRIVESLLWTADSVIDATRVDGRLGYLRAGRARLRPTPSFRLAQWLHRRFRIDQPLMRQMADRFETMQVMHLVLASQHRFLRVRMAPVLGARVAEVVADIAERRRALLDDALETLRLQYPGYAEALQVRMLRQVGLRMESGEFADLRSDALVSDELHRELQRDVDGRRGRLARRMRFSLQAGMNNRLRNLPAFEGLEEAQLHDLAMNLTMRFAAPGERLQRARRRHRSVYFISSGEVAVLQGASELRLGAGAAFGGDGVLAPSVTTGAVVATRFCHLLELGSEYLRDMIDERPALAVRLAGVAALPVGHDRPGPAPAESAGAGEAARLSGR